MTHIAQFGLNWYDYTFAAVFFFVVICIGIRKSGDMSEDDFLVGKRSIPWWLIGPTMAAGVIGGGTLLVLSEYAYKYGFSSFAIVAGLVLGSLLLLPVALGYKEIADKQGFYSLPDLFRHEWGRTAGTLSTIVVAVWTVGFIVMQLISAGKLLHAMAGIPYYLGIVVCALVVAAYLIPGGFRGVVTTDFVQYWALAILLIFVLPVSSQNINLSTTAERSLTINFWEALGFFVLGMLNMVVSADLWQRVYAARGPKNAKMGVWFASMLILGAGVLLMFPALAASSVVSGKGDLQLALVMALGNLAPRILLGFSMAAVLMIVMANLDTMVFLLGLSISHDFFVETLGRSVRYRKLGMQVSMSLSLFVGVVLASLYDNLLQVGITLSTFGLILAPPILLRRRDWKLSPAAVAGSLSFGLAWVALMIIGEFLVGDSLTPGNAPTVLLASILGALTLGLLAWIKQSWSPR